MQIAFLGTGIMGFPMARNAAAAGLEVRAWNRTIEKAEPLAEDGVQVAGDPSEAASGADVVVTMLSDADAVLGLMADAADSCDGAVWAQMSTIGIDGTERAAELADSAELALVDAPVLGTRQPAEAGELIVLAAGRPDVRERCEPLFDAIGKQTHWLADTAGAATRTKVALNTWIVGLVEALAETLSLAEALEVDPTKLLDIIEGGPLDSGYAQMKGKMMIERNFEPSFELKLAAKDAALALEAAGRCGISLPLVGAVHRQMESATAAGHGDEDMAAVFAALREEAAAP